MKKSGSGLKEGVTMSQKFKPEDSSPKSTKHGGRPKAHDPKVKRRNTSVPKM